MDYRTGIKSISRCPTNIHGNNEKPTITLSLWQESDNS